MMKILVVEDERLLESRCFSAVTVMVQKLSLIHILLRR